MISGFIHCRPGGEGPCNEESVHINMAASNCMTAIFPFFPVLTRARGVSLCKAIYLQ